MPVKKASKAGRAVHPFLFALFPPLFLYAQNTGEARLTELVFPLVLVSVASLALLWLSRRLLGSRHRAAVFASAFILAFFSFGRIVSAADRLIPWIERAASAALVAFGLVLLLLALGRRLRKSRPNPALTAVLNLVAGVLVAFQLVQIATAEGRRWRAAPSAETAAAVELALERPDIFYILLDGYAREDVLRKVYGHENQRFLNGLRRRGFRVFDETRASYMLTVLSLASVFNLNPIGNLLELDPESDDLVPAGDKIWDSELVRVLKGQGYSVTAFASGYSPVELPKADRFIRPAWTLSEFQSVLVAQTPIAFLPGRSLAELHRKRINYTLNELINYEPGDRPAFVFAHLLSPHPPFVFDENGALPPGSEDLTFLDGPPLLELGMSRQQYRQKYRSQLVYLNRRLEEVVDALLEDREEDPPVIIIQGDHGPRSTLVWWSLPRSNEREALATLFALHLPNTDLDSFPDSLSITNTFRIVFNRYFGTSYELLPAKSYFSGFREPLKFIEVPQPSSTVRAADLESAPWPLLVLADDGTAVEFDEPVSARELEILLDSRGRFRLEYRLRGRVLATNLFTTQRSRPKGTPWPNTLVVPPAARSGFDRLVIKPLLQDRYYRLGYVRISG